MGKNMDRGWTAIFIGWGFDALGWVFKAIGGVIGTMLSNEFVIGIYVMVFIACVFFWKAYRASRHEKLTNVDDFV